VYLEANSGRDLMRGMGACHAKEDGNHKKKGSLCLQDGLKGSAGVVSGDTSLFISGKQSAGRAGGQRTEDLKGGEGGFLLGEGTAMAQTVTLKKNRKKHDGKATKKHHNTAQDFALEESYKTRLNLLREGGGSIHEEKRKG